MNEKILIIEEDEVLAEAIAITLNVEGYDTVKALSGSDGLDLMYQANPDLVLCEAEKTEPDGFEVCRRIKSNGRFRFIPFIFITSSTSLEQKTAVIKAGADDYLTKPFSNEELLARIEMNLIRARIRYDVDATTGLPSYVSVFRLLKQRLTERHKLALMLVQIKSHEAFREIYGDESFERMLEFTGKTIREVVLKEGSRRDIATSAGIGRFMILTDPAKSEIFAKAIIRLFEAGIRDFYSLADLERKKIDKLDRRGIPVTIPLMTIHIGACSNADRNIESEWQAMAIAEEVLNFCLNSPVSKFLMDRRSDKKRRQ